MNKQKKNYKGQFWSTKSANSHIEEFLNNV